MLSGRVGYVCVVVGLLLGIGFAAGAPTSGLYQISSGRYSELGGFIGSISQNLPNTGQSFIELTIDSQKSTARLRILGADMSTVFSIPAFAPCCNGFAFDLTDGQIFPDHIQFGGGPSLSGQPSLSYTVSNSLDTLRISGSFVRSCPGCADVPTEFRHTNVLASLRPVAVIRSSEVEVCWNAASNRIYQLQYRSTLTGNTWTNIGAGVVGTGTTNCVTTPIPTGEPQRFFRVVPVATP